MFRIVIERKGELTVGYRVQQECFRPANEFRDAGPVWRNRGRRLFDLESARKLKTHLEEMQQAATPEVVYMPVDESLPMYR